MATASSSPGYESDDHDDRVYVGIRELRHDFRAFLDRVDAGEKIVVTDRGKPIADIIPHRRTRTQRERLIEDWGMIPATQPLKPLWDPGDPIDNRLSEELARMRDEERML
jgi:prevent-host-death family protein